MNQVALDHDALTYDGLPPLGARYAEPLTEFDYDVLSIVDYFARVERGCDAAFNVSTALSSLDAASARRPISGEQHDMLASAITMARDQIIELFETEADQKLACKAVDGVLGVVSRWAGNAGQDGRRLLNRADCQAYARWLRNACHNLCLIEEIEMRAQDRRAGKVREILERAIA
ncbi:hypothetical protein [Shinella sp. HZN7]|uniref:hypothetical protein n=1 Tax=Shinella sp. (strain HZN7) TaxID=879274 RepID=UPI0007DA74C1|nr:hypothetical protein [Shinella sp. HZN7]ANH06262.1 hypothetical protein shn_20935 [Shinella sp. HZN7]